jgi:hypothetical protein
MESIRNPFDSLVKPQKKIDRWKIIFIMKVWQNGKSLIENIYAILQIHHHIASIYAVLQI